MRRRTGGPAGGQSDMATGWPAPAFRFAPAVHRRVNRIRLNVDTIGLLAVRIFTSAVHGGPWVQIGQVYEVLAWGTVLTVDSSRLPEHASTRLRQRQSWLLAVAIAPLLFGACAVAAAAFHAGACVGGQSCRPVSSLPGMLAGAYLDELLFRNILQPRLRQIGLSKLAATVAQSLLFAIAFAFPQGSPVLPVCALLLGLANGWLVERSRSLWAAFALSVAWHLWLGI